MHQFSQKQKILIIQNFDPFSEYKFFKSEQNFF